MGKIHRCHGCGGSFLHHELVRHRRKTLVFEGWSEDGKDEVYKWFSCGIDHPLDNIAAKDGSKVELPGSRIRQAKKNALRMTKVKRDKRKPGPRKITIPKNRVQEWDKEPRIQYCTGCGHIFLHHHDLMNHRNNFRCGGRFLPAKEREFLDKIRLEREKQIREDVYWSRLDQ